MQGEAGDVRSHGHHDPTKHRQIRHKLYRLVWDIPSRRRASRTNGGRNLSWAQRSSRFQKFARPEPRFPRIATGDISFHHSGDIDEDAWKRDSHRSGSERIVQHVLQFLPPILAHPLARSTQWRVLQAASVTSLDCSSNRLAPVRREAGLAHPTATAS